MTLQGVTMFQIKMKLWQPQIKANNFFIHFSTFTLNVTYEEQKISSLAFYFNTNTDFKISEKMF